MVCIKEKLCNFFHGTYTKDYSQESSTDFSITLHLSSSKKDKNTNHIDHHIDQFYCGFIVLFCLFWSSKDGKNPWKCFLYVLLKNNSICLFKTT